MFARVNLQDGEQSEREKAAAAGKRNRNQAMMKGMMGDFLVQ